VGEERGAAESTARVPLVIAPRVAAAERDLARDRSIRVCPWGAHARHIGVVVENESLQHAGCTDLQLAQAADVRKHPPDREGSKSGRFVRGTNSTRMVRV
jgi:hypothetical protein